MLNKPIRLSRHARENAAYRGTSEQEITECIEQATWGEVDDGRLECRLDFVYSSIWNGKFYGMKQVRPIFVDEADEIVVVTVYVYYF